MKLFLVFALSITIFTQNAFTQTKGSISGKVIDKSVGAVPKAVLEEKLNSLM